MQRVATVTEIKRKLAIFAGTQISELELPERDKPTVLVFDSWQQFEAAVHQHRMYKIPGSLVFLEKGQTLQVFFVMHGVILEYTIKEVNE